MSTSRNRVRFGSTRAAGVPLTGRAYQRGKFMDPGRREDPPVADDDRFEDEPGPRAGAGGGGRAGVRAARSAAARDASASKPVG